MIASTHTDLQERISVVCATFVQKVPTFGMQSVPNYTFKPHPASTRMRDLGAENGGLYIDIGNDISTSELDL